MLIKASEIIIISSLWQFGPALSYQSRNNTQSAFNRTTATKMMVQAATQQIVCNNESLAQPSKVGRKSAADKLTEKINRGRKLAGIENKIKKDT
jgi:hypothetical protein